MNNLVLIKIKKVNYYHTAQFFDNIKAESQFVQLCCELTQT